MKNKCLTMIVILLLAMAAQSEASIVYNFGVNVDYTGLTAVQKIQGIEFTISGIQGTDWVFNGFSSAYDGKWFFSSTGIIDDTYVSPDIGTSVPLNSGTIFSLLSNNDSVITVSNIVPFDYQNNDFTGTSFNAQLAPVPIPAAAWLLGSGLVGLVALRRRQKK